jgi:phenylalanyl-tRNA synthetase beta subunit
MKARLNLKIKQINQENSFSSLGSQNIIKLKKQCYALEVNDKIVSVPGITGGSETSVEKDSKDFIVELANFDPELVSKNSFDLNIRTDSSKLFAGGLSKSLPSVFLKRLKQLLPDNTRISQILKWDSSQIKNAKQNDLIKVDLDYLSLMLDDRGVNYWRETIIDKLNILGKYDSLNQTLELNCYYQKIVNQDELLCELVKLIGLDNLQPQVLYSSTGYKTDSEENKLNYLKTVLTNFGFSEVITRPFVSEEDIYNKNNSLKVLNPYSQLYPFLRDNLYTSLFKTGLENIFRGEKSPKIFELNETFSKLNLQNNGIQRSKVLTGVYFEKDPYLSTTVLNFLFNKETNSNLKFEYKQFDNEVGSFLQFIDLEGSIRGEILEFSNSYKTKVGLAENKNCFAFTYYLPVNLNLKTNKKYYEESLYPVVKRSVSFKIPKSILLTEIIIKILNLEFTNQETIVRIKPIERFELDKNYDKLNLDLDFVSYNTNLKSEDILNWINSLPGAITGVEIIN